MKYCVISDIHGHDDAYCDLLDRLTELEITPATHHFVQLGDFIDGALQTKQVVERLMAQENTTVLMGNHEHLMLDALVFGNFWYGDYYLWWSQGGRQTIQSYTPTELPHYQRALAGPLDVIPKEHIEWIKQLPTYLETEHFIFVHAGITPGETIQGTTPMQRMWVRDMFIDCEEDWGKTVIYGHTPTPTRIDPYIQKFKVGIDTMHHGYGRVTAVIVDDSQPHLPMQFVQSRMFESYANA